MSKWVNKIAQACATLVILAGIAAEGSAQAATLSVNQPSNLNFGTLEVGQTSAAINIVFTTTIDANEALAPPLELNLIGGHAPHFSFANNGCFALVCNVDLFFSPLSPVFVTNSAVLLFRAFFFDPTNGIVNNSPAQAAFFLSGIGVEPLTQTPVPAALPLFATGLGVLGLLMRRRKRRQSASAS